MTDVQLDAAALHAAARDKDGDPPPVFAASNARLEASEIERRAAMDERDDLLREARRIGVPMVALARWTDLKARRIDQIVNDR